jgi:hypothetical protein
MFDNVSVIIRHTLIQMRTPDEMRGRVSAVNMVFIGSSNEIGGFESGTVAHFFGPVISVVSGGIGTLIVVAVTSWLSPAMRRFGRLVEEPDQDEPSSGQPPTAEADTTTTPASTPDPPPPDDADGE